MIIAKTIRFFKVGIIVLQAAAVVVALWETYKKLHEDGTIQHTDPDMKKKFAKGKRDIIDESSWESFPASDPPASNKFT